MNAAEDLLAIHLAELGLHFIRQFAYTASRKFRADFAVWQFDASKRSTNKEPPRLCLIEVTGGIYSKQAHGSVTGVLKDNERLFEAFKARWPMIRVTPQQVESGEAKAMIAARMKEDSR